MPSIRQIAAACGFSKTTVAAALRNDNVIAESTRTLVPNIPASMGHLSKIPVFQPRFQATVDADAMGAVFTIISLVDCTEIPVRILELAKPAALFLDDVPVSAESLPSVEQFVSYRVNVVLKAGSRLVANYL